MSKKTKMISLSAAYLHLSNASHIKCNDCLVNYTFDVPDADLDVFLNIRWDDDDGEYDYFFYPTDNCEVEVTGNKMVLTDSEGDEVEIELYRMVPVNCS